MNSQISGDTSSIHLPNLWRAILRGWAWIVLTPLVLGLVVFVWTRLQQPEYESTASLVVDTETSERGLLASQMAAFAGFGGVRSSLETDLRLLESRQIAEGVVDSLSLHVELAKPRVPRGELFSLVEAERDAFAGILHLTRRPDGQYDVTVEVAERSERRDFPVPQRIAVDQPFEVGGVRLQFAPEAREQLPETIEVHVLLFRSAVQRFVNELEIARAGTSSVIEVSARHTDPELTAAMANSVVARFVEYRRQTTQSEARGAIDFLHAQIAEYETQLREAEDRLREYREEELVVSPDAAASQQAQRLSTLEAQRAELIAEREVLAGLIADVSASSSADAGNSAYRRLAVFPEFFRNPAVQNILSSLVQLENQRAELLVQRTMENVDVRGLSDRIEELEEQLYLTATSYLAGLDEQIAAADRTLAGSTGQAARVPQVQTEFVRLTRQVELLDEIYALLQMRLKEQEVAEADARSDIRMLDAALVPLRPASPRPLLSLVLALIVGGMLGVGIALARALFDPALYSRGAALAAAGGVPILTSIPDPRGGMPRLLPAGGRALLRRALPGGENRNGSFAGPMADPAAEAYTDLRTRLTMFTQPRPQVVLVTSPREGDGKTTVAANLALAFANHGTRTLLLEGDLRRAGLARQLKTAASARGLGHVLHGSATAAEVIQPYPGTSGDAVLDVLLAGESPRHPTELLDSPALSRLMEELRSHYEMVVVDSPPLGAVADALLLAQQSDGALVVTRAGATDRAAMEETLAELSAVGARVHGLVLNGFSDRPGGRYSYS